MNVNPYHVEKVNRNLLDNAYFARPVNQRGQTEYVGPCYTIDRWKINEFGLNHTLQVVDGGIVIDGYPDVAHGWSVTMYQVLANPLEKGTYTISFLETDGTLTEMTLEHDGATSTRAYGHFIATIEQEYNTCGFAPEMTKAATIAAVKLEKGDHQTLAHLEDGKWVLNDVPDYAEELAKCQRYQIVFNDGQYSFIGTGNVFTETRAPVFVPLPVTLRAKPTVQTEGTWAISSSGLWAQGIPTESITCHHLVKNGALLYANVSVEHSLTSKMNMPIVLVGIGGAKMILDANL